MPDIDTDTSTGEALPPQPQQLPQSNFHPLDAVKGFLDRIGHSSAFSMRPPTPPAQQPPAQPQEQQPFLQQIPQPIPDISQKLKPIATAPVDEPRQPTQNYTPAGMRNHTEWGKIRERDLAARKYPDLMASTSLFPDDQQSINIIRGAGPQLARFAAPSVGQPMALAANIASIIGPFFDYFSNNAFSTAYRQKMLGGMQMEEHQMRMQEEQMAIDRERMQMYAGQAMANHKVMLDDYGQVFDDLRNHRITPEQAKNEILQLNATHNHHVLDGVLANQGLSGVWNQLHWEDAKFQDTMSALTSLDITKAKKSGKEPGETSGDSLIETGTATQPGTTTAGGLGAPYTDETKAVGVAPTSRPESQEETDAEIAKEEDMPTAAGMPLAHELARFGTVDGATKTELPKLYPKYASNLQRAAGNIDRRISDVLADPSLSKVQKDQALNAIDRDMANQIRDISNYSKHSTEIPAGTIRDKFEGWASTYSGGKYKESNYANAKEFSDFGKPASNNIRMVAALPQANLNAQTIINQLPENEPIPLRVIQHLGEGTLAGDPKWGALDEAMQNYIQNASGAMTGTSPRVTLIELMRKRATSNMSPAQLRLILQQDAADAWAKAEPYVRQWREEFGQPGLPPYFNKTAIAAYSAILRQNAYTGQMPDDPDTPYQYRSIGKDPSKTSYSGYVKGHEGTPWTIKQYREYDERMKRLGSDPSPEAQKAYQEGLKRRPPAAWVTDPPWDYLDAE